MDRKVIGKVSEEEKDQIEKLFERKNGLSELLFALDENTLLDEKTKDEIYNKLVADMGKTGTAFDKWWLVMKDKYGWTNQENYNYRIDFITNEVLLENNVVKKHC
jgi:CXXX repeat modification system protein